VKPRLLDLFCGAGGAAMGYQRAGFYVVGVDIAPQPNYVGDEFWQMDAMIFPLDGYDAIHASPPCQGYGSTLALNLHKNGRVPDHPRLIAPTRERLQSVGLPCVIENIPTARPHLRDPVLLCGSMFGLGVRRHRLFESNVLILRPSCAHLNHEFVGVYGDHPEARTFGENDVYNRRPRAATLVEARTAMGMDWADWRGTKEAIPPAYTEYIGAQLLASIGAAA